MSTTAETAAPRVQWQGPVRVETPEDERRNIVITVRMTRLLKQRIDGLRKKKGISLNTIATTALVEFLDRLDRDEAAAAETAARGGN